ncbi:MAG TPA: hypothetical protein PKM60_15130 [Zoogloea sp.]|nr:hypothetical protein [Zoogloea sp.]HQE40470.1 hypothetical protein [Zoogloea sp.]
MRIATEITVRRCEAQQDDDIPQCELLVAGAVTGCRLSGAILEAAVEVAGKYLLFMTDDVPFEETLTLHLLDGQFRLLDSASVGRAYATGVFSLVELREPDELVFRFIGETPWAVKLLDGPALRVPLCAEAPGVTRPFGFTRHFIVRHPA